MRIFVLSVLVGLWPAIVVFPDYNPLTTQNIQMLPIMININCK